MCTDAFLIRALQTTDPTTPTTKSRQTFIRTGGVGFDGCLTLDVRERPGGERGLAAVADLS